MFGESIKLNFGKKGNEHKTYFGGVVSTLLLIYLCYFGIQKGLNVINHGDNKHAVNI